MPNLRVSLRSEINGNLLESERLESYLLYKFCKDGSTRGNMEPNHKAIGHAL